MYFAKKNGLTLGKGKQITGKEKCYSHVAVLKDGTVKNVPAFAWVKCDDQNIMRVSFKDFIKNEKAQR